MSLQLRAKAGEFPRCLSGKEGIFLVVVRLILGGST